MPSRSRSRGLGKNDPFAMAVGPARADLAPVVDPIIPTGPKPPEPAPGRGPSKRIPRDKHQITAYMDAGVVDDARNAVLALLPNPAGHRSLSALVEDAMRREVRRLQDTYNGGHSFPARQVELQAGQATGTLIRGGGAKERLSVYVAASVDNDARNAVLALMPNPAGHRSLSALVEHAMRCEVRRLQDEHNHGQPFPPRRAPIPPGRPATA